jgi:hypothetical protein
MRKRLSEVAILLGEQASFPVQDAERAVDGTFQQERDGENGAKRGVLNLSASRPTA